MFAEFLKKDNFYYNYIKHYATRMASTNVKMEEIAKTKKEQTINIYENIISFIKLIDQNKEITPFDLIEVADNINKTQGIAKGFRKIQVDIKKADFFPIAPYMVPQAVYSLFDNYNNTWKDLNVYEREALFHINLVRIQPFEDGNKRTARIITNYNLVKQNRAPIIIEKEELDEYWNYINNYDVEGFTNFLKNKSQKEFKEMIYVYEKTCTSSLVYSKKDDKSFLEVARKILKDIQKLEEKETKRKYK